jgi:hypothetical protein
MLGLALTGAGPAAGAGGLDTGGEATALQAQEVVQRTDPAVLTPSSSASLEGQSVQPAISVGGEELSSTGALTSSTISKETAGEFAVNTRDGELSVAPLDASPVVSTPTVVNGAAALFAGAWPATDAIVRPNALGVTTILRLRSSEAPASFSWEVGLGPGQRLRQLADGSVAVVDGPPAPVGPPWEGPLEDPLEALGATASGQAVPGELRPQETQVQGAAATSSVAAAEQQTGGTSLMVVEPPTAADARGGDVPASLSVVGSTLTVSMSPAPTTVFPVMVAVTVAAASNRASATRPQDLRYGLSDQRAAAFGSAFDRRLLEGPLHVRVARLVLPYEAVLASTEKREEREKAEKKLEFTQSEALTRWLRKVQEVNTRGEHLQPYITLWSKGCLDRATCRVPPIKRYREAVRALIKDHMKAAAGLPAVRLWGAWNEPDGDNASLSAAQAGELWQVAHSVMVELHCGCTMVAGEFAEFGPYVSRYKAFMVKHHLKPRVWGLHDYRDLVPGPSDVLANQRAGEDGDTALGEYENRDARAFAKLTSTRLGKPRIWLSEQGVELDNGFKPTPLADNPESQRISAEDFLRLASVSRRVELVDYYMYGAPSPSGAHPRPENEAVFDSALVNGRSEPSPAYCVVAFPGHWCPPIARIDSTGLADPPSLSSSPAPALTRRSATRRPSASGS